MKSEADILIHPRLQAPSAIWSRPSQLHEMSTAHLCNRVDSNVPRLAALTRNLGTNK